MVEWWCMIFIFPTFYGSPLVKKRATSFLLGQDAVL